MDSSGHEITGSIELSWASLSEITVTENSNTQQDDGIGVANVPPQWHLGGVSETLLQLLLLFWTQLLDAFLLLQAAEAHHCLLAQTWLVLWFCNRQRRWKESKMYVCKCTLMLRVGLLPSNFIESESCWLSIQSSCSRSTLSSVLCLRLQHSRYN